MRAVKAAVSPGDEAQPKQETKDGSLPQKSEDKDPNRAWETGAVLDGEGVCREGEGSEGAETSGPPSGPRGTPNGLCWAQGHIAWLESRGWQTGDTGSPTRVTESQPDPPGSNENMVNAFLHVYGAPATRKKGNPVSGPAGPEEEGDAGSKGVEEADAANPARGPMERLRFPGVDYAEVEADESLQEVLVVRNRPEVPRTDPSPPSPSRPPSPLLSPSFLHGDEQPLPNGSPSPVLQILPPPPNLLSTTHKCLSRTTFPPMANCNALAPHFPSRMFPCSATPVSCRDVTCPLSPSRRRPSAWRRF